MKFKKDLRKHIHRFDTYDIVQAFKIMGNQYRMNILLALEKQSNITLDQINGLVGGEFKNISAHTKKLFEAGLIEKKYIGVAVQHKLSEYGKVAVKVFRIFQKDPYL